jgi:hypothetical protein
MTQTHFGRVIAVYIVYMHTYIINSKLMCGKRIGVGVVEEWMPRVMGNH